MEEKQVVRAEVPQCGRGITMTKHGQRALLPHSHRLVHASYAVPNTELCYSPSDISVAQ